MKLQSDSFSRSIQLFRELGTSLLSGSEVFASWQFDSLQESMTRNTQQLRTAITEAGTVQEPLQLPETVQTGLRNAIKVSRDYLIATTDYQMESLRMLQSLRSEMQQIITDAMNEQLVNLDVATSREKRKGKGTALAAQEIAA
jgi:protein involved in ribonucleotide reduction